MTTGILRKSVATLGAVLGLSAQAVSPSAGSATGFEARFAPLYATVFTEGASFSGKAMSADLQALEPLVKKSGVAASDVFRLFYTEASVYGRRGMPAEAAKAAQAALVAMPQVSDPQWAYAHFFLRYSSIRWLADSEQYEAALKLVRSFQSQYPLPQIERLPVEMRWDDSHPIPQARDFPSQLQILGVYEDEGYVLHEQGKYREARLANERLLPVSRQRLKALGKMERMRGLLTNIAQNCYELGEFDQARTYLQERLQIALNVQDHATVYDCYFQLMVLAHEQKQAQRARQWLTRYEQYALAQNDSQQQARAKELLAELGQRNTGHR